MSLNKTKIEWTDYTWNPVTGCLHNCWYCYAKKMFTRFHKSFEPTFYQERLDEPSKLKKNCKIFCCSVSDLFASWTKPEWRNQVIKSIESYSKTHPNLVFQILTKDPDKIDKDYIFPDNLWIGVTVNNQSETWKIEELKMVNCKVKFVSFEPLLSKINYELDGIDWIIIGKLTGSRKVKLQDEWVENIIKEARFKKVPVFVKDNVNWKESIQEFP